MIVSMQSLFVALVIVIGINILVLSLSLIEYMEDRFRKFLRIAIGAFVVATAISYFFVNYNMFLQEVPIFVVVTRLILAFPLLVAFLQMIVLAKWYIASSSSTAVQTWNFVQLLTVISVIWIILPIVSVFFFEILLDPYIYIFAGGLIGTLIFVFLKGVSTETTVSLTKLILERAINYISVFASSYAVYCIISGYNPNLAIIIVVALLTIVISYLWTRMVNR